MTIPRIVTLLSVLALLASLPLTMVLAQTPPPLPFQVIGPATLDGEPVAEGTMVVAMIDGEKAVETMIGIGGMFNDLTAEGAEGAMVTFEIMMGEGDEAMMYMAMPDEDVMVGCRATSRARSC